MLPKRELSYVCFSCRDELLAAILELVSRLNQWLEAQGRIKVAKESLQDCHQQMALVKEAEAHGPSAQHPLYTLAGRYAKHCRARDAKEKARAALREKIEDCEKHLNLHKVIEILSKSFYCIDYSKTSLYMKLEICYHFNSFAPYSDGL
jgi:hypothetical protein